jgi:2-polyprenyl-6-methoxyphenol hydroxylase-like FAD-dependent oxidoreductase
MTNGNAATVLETASGTHAVVVGGSIAGLFAASVLARRFDRVTVVERDRFPAGPTFRKGVPQSRHSHVLWQHGIDLADSLLPGTSADLRTAGAVPVGLPSELLWLNAAGWGRQFPATHEILCCSRELMESVIRGRVAAPGVEFLQGHDVTGLLADESSGAVIGVKLRARPDRGQSHDGGLVDELSADLVVDASGRGSHAPRWLAELGYDAPPETRINSFLGYATRRYAIPTDVTAGWKIMFILPSAPDFPRGASLTPLEGDRWILTLNGAARDYPPTDEDGFLEFARSVRSPLLYEVLREAEPLTPIHGYQRTENIRRRYDKMPGMPARFIVLGDAACALNPVYAQGMTLAARQAAALDRSLGRWSGRSADLPRVARRAQRAAAKSVEGAWMIATGEDLRYPTTIGGQARLPDRLVQRYMDRVFWAACGSPAVATAVLDVLNLIDPPQALLHPRVMLSALTTRTGPLQVPPTPIRLAEQLLPA